LLQAHSGVHEADVEMPAQAVLRPLSGIGRENGVEAIRDFLETKSVWVSTGSSIPANPFIMR
jgi:hypothetical protein